MAKYRVLRSFSASGKVLERNTLIDLDAESLRTKQLIDVRYVTPVDAPKAEPVGKIQKRQSAAQE
jgi:hypothetical protein